MRRTARMTGVLYLLTFVSIPTLALYRPVRDRVDFVLGAGSDTGVLWGAFCEVVVALACVGTAVVLFPVAKRQSETAALGFVTARVVEAGLIIVGVVNVLSIVTLRRDVAGTDGADPAALHGRSGSGCGLRLGVPSLAEPDARGQRAVPGIRDVPVTAGAPHPPVVGLLGAPLLLASDIAIFFGVYDRMAPIAGLAAVPIAAWEFSLGVYLLVKGFRPAAVASLPTIQAIR